MDSSRHLSIHIDRPVRDVYDYASNPANAPEWAAGLAGSIEQVDGQWVADSPMGRIVVAFAPGNDFGVLDHDVTLPSGQTIHNPMRVIQDGDGSEVVFTLRRRPELTDAGFAADAEAVQADLRSLKQHLEQ